MGRLSPRQLAGPGDIRLHLALSSFISVEMGENSRVRRLAETDPTEYT